MTSSTRRNSDVHVLRISSKRESMWERKSLMREFTSPNRELLIKIPIRTVNFVGTEASAIDNIWPGLISMLLIQR